MREQAERIANDPREQELARQILEEWEDATASWPYDVEEGQEEVEEGQEDGEA